MRNFRFFTSGFAFSAFFCVTVNSFDIKVSRHEYFHNNIKQMYFIKLKKKNQIVKVVKS